MIVATMSNAQTVTIRGIDLDLAPRAWWRPWIAKIGKAVQDYIAWLFEQESDGQGRPLKMNSPAYTLRKIKQGYSAKRGHRTGMLQRRLHGAQLFTVGPINPAGEVRIFLSDARLLLLQQNGVIGYVSYYIQNKIQGNASIMKLARRFLPQAIAVPLAELNFAVAAKRLSSARPSRIVPTRGLTPRQVGAVATSVRRDQRIGAAVLRVFGRGFLRPR